MATSRKGRTRGRDNLWFLHNPPTPTRTHASLQDLRGLWPVHEATLACGKRQAAVRSRAATPVTIDDITVTVPGEQALITDDNAIIVTAATLVNPPKLLRKILEYEEIRTRNPRATMRVLITAVPVAAGVTYVILSKPEQSPTILIGGLSSIASMIVYNSYYIGIHFKRNELTSFLERELGGETCTQGKAIDHSITTVRDGYDEILRQLTAREVGPRKASLLAPEFQDALQQSNPERVASYIAQLFPGTGDPGLTHLLTIR